LKDFLTLKFEFVVAAVEEHVSGNLHVHMLVQKRVTRPARVTDIFKRWYLNNDIEWSNNACRTVRGYYRPGACNYVLKYVEDELALLVIRGYQWSWLSDEVRRGKLNMKSTPLKKKICLNRGNAVDIIINYIDANKLEVCSVIDLRDAMMRMDREGYNFLPIWSSMKGLTACLMNRLTEGGEDAQMRWSDAMGDLDSYVQHLIDQKSEERGIEFPIVR